MRTDVVSIATPTTSRRGWKLGLTAPAMALLALASSGCDLFGKKPTEQPVVAEPTPAEPTCKAPDGSVPAPVGTTIVPLEMWNDAIVGTTVYSTVWESIKSRDLVLIGEPLTICSFGNSGTSKQGDYEVPPHPITATVMTVTGKSFEVPVEILSTTPPLLSLAAPGKVEDLIKTTFIHAHAIQMAWFQINKSYTTEELRLAKKVGDVWESNWDYTVADGLKRAGDSANSQVLTYLVRGKMGRETLLGQAKYAWVAQAEDDRIVDWFAEGSLSAPDTEVYQAMISCVANLETVNTSFSELARIEKKRSEKKWREGLEASESKLAKMDAAEEKKLNADKERTLSFINEHYDSKDCKKAREFAGIAAPPAPF
jgi:hypothetical protein